MGRTVRVAIGLATTCIAACVAEPRHRTVPADVAPSRIAPVVQDPVRELLATAAEAEEGAIQAARDRLLALPEAADRDLVAAIQDESAGDHVRAIALILLAQRASGSTARSVTAMHLAEQLLADELTCERLWLVAELVTKHLATAPEPMFEVTPPTTLRDFQVSAAGARLPRFLLNEHWKELTEPALRQDLHWRNEASICSVIDANLATDLESLDRTWTLWWVSFGYPTANDRTNDVEALRLAAKMEFHFDNLFTWADVVAEWTRLQCFVQKRLCQLEATPWPQARRETLVLLGIVHHAVQDFYCHSNWCHVFTHRAPTMYLPTWDYYQAHLGLYPTAKQILEASGPNTVSSDRKSGGLQTGAWGSFACPACGGVKPWKHVHVRREHDIAVRVARRATVEWTLRFENMMSDVRRGQFRAETQQAR